MQAMLVKAAADMAESLKTLRPKDQALMAMQASLSADFLAESRIETAETRELRARTATQRGGTSAARTEATSAAAAAARAPPPPPPPSDSSASSEEEEEEEELEVREGWRRDRAFLLVTAMQCMDLPRRAPRRAALGGVGAIFGGPSSGRSSPRSPASPAHSPGSPQPPPSPRTPGAPRSPCSPRSGPGAPSPGRVRQAEPPDARVIVSLEGAEYAGPALASDCDPCGTLAARDPPARGRAQRCAEGDGARAAGAAC